MGVRDRREVGRTRMLLLAIMGKTKAVAMAERAKKIGSLVRKMVTKVANLEGTRVRIVKGNRMIIIINQHAISQLPNLLGDAMPE
jgi:hypothetical protein